MLQGTYTTAGFEIDPNKIQNPKVFFYGKYKGSLKIKFQNNTLVGCFIVEFDMLRPWELPKQ